MASQRRTVGLGEAGHVRGHRLPLVPRPAPSLGQLSWSPAASDRAGRPQTTMCPEDGGPGRQGDPALSEPSPSPQPRPPLWARPVRTSPPPPATPVATVPVPASPLPGLWSPRPEAASSLHVCSAAGRTFPKFKSNQSPPSWNPSSAPRSGWLVGVPSAADPPNNR